MYQKKVSEIFLRLVRPSEVRSVTSFVLDFPTTRAQFYYCFLFSDLICRALLHSHQCTLLLPHLLAEKKDGLPAPFFFPERHIFFFFSSSSHNISDNRWRRKRNTYTHTIMAAAVSHAVYTEIWQVPVTVLPYQRPCYFIVAFGWGEERMRAERKKLTVRRGEMERERERNRDQGRAFEVKWMVFHMCVCLSSWSLCSKLSRSQQNT